MKALILVSAVLAIVAPALGTLVRSRVENIDRNARAYGYEIGRGAPLAHTVQSSPGNPFLDPSWKRSWHEPH